MLGPEGVARGVTGRLVDRLPAKVEEIRARYAASTEDLPTPETEDIHPTTINALALGRYPAFMVSVINNVGRSGSARPVQSTEKSGTFDEYEYRYRVAILFYTSGADYAPVDLSRYRYALALRELLLSDKTIPVTDPDEGIRIDDLTVREEFDQGMAQIEETSFIGAAQVEVEVVATERLNVEGFGPAAVNIHPIDLQ